MPIQPSQPLERMPEDDYDRLPEPIKATYTRAEYLWLSDAEKSRLIETECEPEW